MYLLRRFLGPRWDRINAILDLHFAHLRSHVILIASSSYPFPEVLDAYQYPLCVVPMEGMIGDRYFPGSQPVDAIEHYAEECVRKLFGIDDAFGVCIQPHSGTQANQVVFNAVLAPNDRVLSLAPEHGGHISHHVLVGRRNPVTHFGLNADEAIDYDSVEQIANECRPRLLVAGTSSYPRALDFTRLGSIARSVGALLHADVSHTALFAMSGHHSSPFPHADFATFNPMKNLRGPSGGVVVYRASLERQIRRAVFPGTQGGPLTSIMLAKAVAFHRLLSTDLRQYAGQIIANAQRFGRRLEDRGLRLTTGGTDMHYVVVDLRSEGTTGLAAEERLERNRILVNRNRVPGDPNGPRIASGIRIGLTCVTILGYSPGDLDTLADIVARLCRTEDPGAPTSVRRLTELYQSAMISGASAVRG